MKKFILQQVALLLFLPVLLFSYQSCTGGESIEIRLPDSTPATGAPTLTGISPAAGDISGGTGITLTGTNLADTSSVTFDGTSASGLTIVNDTTLTALTPAHAAGTVDVALTTPDGTATLAGAFTYQSLPSLSAVVPSSGSASGGVGFTLTGANLAAATSVTFDGIAATSINIVNSTTVTGVAPAHATGAVDVEITTPNGTTALSGGFTYMTTAVGQSISGGVIACLGGGLANLIAATADNSASIAWRGTGTLINANSNNDGSSNTALIVAALGTNGGIPYAAQICNDFEIDSQGNTPCQGGNTCYNDWFLPALDQDACLYTNRADIGGFSSTLYWSSTEIDSGFSYIFNFGTGTNSSAMKGTNRRVRCTKSFTP